MKDYFRQNTLFFKYHSTTSEIELWDGKLLVGNILYLSNPINGFHYLISKDLPNSETIFCTSLSLAKTQLVLNYQLDKVNYING